MKGRDGVEVDVVEGVEGGGLFWMRRLKSR